MLLVSIYFFGVQRIYTEDMFMDFRDYSYVQAIAEHGNISNAAEALYISQPSLSKFLSKLETQIGTPLFQRVNKRMKPTYAGELFLSTGEKIFILQNRLNDALVQISQEEEGRLSIATTSTRGNYVLPTVLPEFKKTHPKYHIKIFEGDADEVEHSLHEGSSNIAILTISSRNPDFTYYNIATEEVILIMSPESPFADKYEIKEGFRYPWIDLSLLKKETFYLNEPYKWRIGQISRELLYEAHIDPEISYLRSHDTCLAFACRGMGYTFSYNISYDYFRNFITPPIYRSVGCYPRTVEFVVATRNGYRFSKAELVLLDLLKKNYAAMSPVV